MSRPAGSERRGDDGRVEHQLRGSGQDRAPGQDRGGALRRAACGLLILATLAHLAARIVTVESVHLQRTASNQVRLVASPLLSANDRSRWCAIRSLVDDQTWAIDRVLFDPDTGLPDPGWYTIDMVRHKGADGKEHYYSSKPPLFSALLSGLYWVVKKTTGAGLGDRPFFVVRVMLLLVNLLPLGVYFWLLWRLVERHGTTDWARLFVMAIATWGTFLTTFGVTLNNHLPAAICVLLLAEVGLSIWNAGRAAWWRFVAAGLLAGLTVANELPAASLLVLLACGLFWKSPWQTVFGYVPAACLVLATLLGSNYLAHQSWRLPYMHRADGQVLATWESPDTELDAWTPPVVPPELRERLGRAGIDISTQAVLLDSEQPDRWVLWDRDGQDRLAVCRSSGHRSSGHRTSGHRSSGTVEVRAWDNWYEYPGSYWTDQRKAGVDRGEPSRAVYAFHVLLGHHGFFSLTPVWLIGILGIVLCWRRRDDPLRSVAVLTLGLTLICLVFYVARPIEDRNYGGVTTGLRWLFWLIPLWLLVTLRGADGLAGSAGLRRVALAALAISIFSAAYGYQNPWTQPWLFDWWSQLGWIRY